MNLYSISLGATLRWNVKLGDPSYWPVLSEFDGCILNPLVVLGDEKKPTVFQINDKTYHVITNFLFICIPNHVAVDEILQALQLWLRLLRIASKQASFPVEVYSLSLRTIDFQKIELAYPAHQGKGTLIGEFHIHTALNEAALNLANGWNSETAVPLFHELLLDALHACEVRRYRDAILYSAIAVEALAQHELTRIYEEALLMTLPPIHLNILDFSQAGGVVVKKDPIFSLLTESDNFGRLLHEIPLYLIRRSLLKEKPDLYKQAKNLYGTRNRLSHGQAIPVGENNRLQVDAGGANMAVGIAVDIFNWFGKNGYHIPDRQMFEFPQK